MENQNIRIHLKAYDNKILDLSPEDLVKLNEMIEKFPPPPNEIYVPPSSVSNMKSTVTNYFKGFFSGGSSKEQPSSAPKVV